MNFGATCRNQCALGHKEQNPGAEYHGVDVYKRSQRDRHRHPGWILNDVREGFEVVARCEPEEDGGHCGDSPAFEVYPSFSPDGRWITYASNDSGVWEIYVRRFPDNGTRVRVSTSGGVVPRWSPNGRELLYRTDAQRLMAVTYKADADSFVVSTPRPWPVSDYAVNDEALGQQGEPPVDRASLTIVNILDVVQRISM
jgi:WD40-like Beta Propeller Repeat